jgi:FkbM family methyltransferase
MIVNLPKPVKSALQPIYISLSCKSGRNYFYVHGEKLYFTKETFYDIWDLTGGDKTKEGVPLSIFKLNRNFDGAIDVGGHHGVYSLLIKKLNPELDVYAFEPDGRNIEVMQTLFDKNNALVHIQDLVVTDHSGEISFYIDPQTGSQRHSTTKQDEFTEVVKPCISLSDFITDQDLSKIFLKIDAEGEEYQIISDIQNLGQSISGIVEIHPDKLNKTKEKFLQLLNREFHTKFIAESSSNQDRPIYYFSNEGVQDE